MEWRRSTVAACGAACAVVVVFCAWRGHLWVAGGGPGRRIPAAVLSVQGGDVADDAARRQTGPTLRHFPEYLFCDNGLPPAQRVTREPRL